MENRATSVKEKVLKYAENKRKNMTQCDDSPATPPSKLFYHDLLEILRQAKDWSYGRAADEGD